MCNRLVIVATCDFDANQFAATWQKGFLRSPSRREYRAR
jgi:hypothetical protein